MVIPRNENKVCRIEKQTLPASKKGLFMCLALRDIGFESLNSGRATLFSDVRPRRKILSLVGGAMGKMGYECLDPIPLTAKLRFL